MSHESSDSSKPDADATLRDDQQMSLEDSTLNEETDGTVELSADDIEPLDASDASETAGAESAESTLVMDREQIEARVATDQEARAVDENEAQAAADGETDADGGLRSTQPLDSVEREALDAERTNTFDVPDELLSKSVRTTEQRQRIERDEAGDIVIATGESTTGESKTIKMETLDSQPITTRMPAIGAQPEVTVERPLSEGSRVEIDKEGYHTFIIHVGEDRKVELPAELFGEDGEDGALLVIKAKRLSAE